MQSTNQSDSFIDNKVCMNCDYVKYLNGGVWICKLEGDDLKKGVKEVHPLWKGCVYFKEKGSGK